MLVGELISLYRKEHGMSQRQFAKKCGDVSNGYISMLENNFNPATGKGIAPTFEKLKSIAKGMDMEVDELFRLVDDMPIDISGENTTDEDDELCVLREELRRNPEIRMLFSASRGAKKEHIKAAAAMLNALKGNDDSLE